MASTIKVDKLDPQSGTALEIGTSGDTITVPTGAGLTVTDEVKTNKISPATGTAFALGDSGDTFTVPSGATIANLGTATGFGGSGRILQTEAINVANTTTITSTSLVDTYLTDTITPASTGSKIFISYGWESKLNQNEGYGTAIKRAIDGGATTVVAEQQAYNYWCSHDNGELRWFPMICYVDSPSTTAEITYTIQVKGNNTNTIEWIAHRMIMMEIGA